MKTTFRILLMSALALMSLEGLMLTRSSSHLEAARKLQSTGRILESAREYQSCIGFSAPWNPFADSAVRELERLAAREKTEHPQLGEDLEDRLIRSIRGTRSFYQPNRKTLSRLMARREKSP